MASLAEIVKEIQSTNDLLTDNAKAQNRVNQLMIDQARDADAARMDALAETKKSKTATKVTSKGSIKGFGSGFKQGLGATALEGWGTALIGKLFSGVAGAGLLGAITGLFGLALGKIVFTAATIGLVATFGGKLIESLFETLDPEGKYVDDIQKKGIARSITSAAILGLTAAIFGPKFGLAVFAGKLITDAITNNLLSEDAKKKLSEPIASAFGLEFTGKSLSTMGFAIAGVFGIPAIMSALAFALTGKASKVSKGRVGRNSLGQFTKLKPGLLTGFRLGFASRVGIAGGIAMIAGAYGGVVSDALGEFINRGTDPNGKDARFTPEMTKALSSAPGNILTAAAMGFALGGPYGALAGAIVGGALSIMSIVKAYVDKRNEEALDRYSALLSGLQAKRAQLIAEEGENPADMFSQLKMNRLNRGITGEKMRVAAEKLKLKIFTDEAAGKTVSDAQREKLKRITRAAGEMTSLAYTATGFMEPSGKKVLRSLGNQANNPSVLGISGDKNFTPIVGKDVNYANSLDAATMAGINERIVKNEITAEIIGSKDMSTHQQVSMLPATRPATIDTTTPQFIMMYGQRAMNPFGGM